MSFASTVTSANDSSLRLRERSQNEKLSAKNVREVREKLSIKTGGRPEFQYDLLFMFAKNELSASLAIPLFAVVIASVAILWVPLTHIAAWLASLFVCKGILLHLCQKFLKVPRNEVKVKDWRSKLVIGELLYGCSWALLVFTPIEGGAEAVYILIFAIFIVVISMTMMFTSTVLPIVYAGTIPITAVLAFKFFSMADTSYWVLASIAVGVHGYFIYLIKGLNNTVLTMLSYRAEKDALIAEIEQSKSISDQARRNAEDASSAKSRFLATVSHELRTPLNAIIGFSEVMKSELLGKHSNPTYKDYASDIYDSGQHLLKLINEILDLSRIEAGRYELHEQDVLLKDIIEDCHRLTKLRAQEKRITIKLAAEENLTAIWGDERAIRQICLNLLSNAIKFTPAQGIIQLAVGMTDDGSQFLTVTDSGPGMAKEEIPKVLMSFGQGSLAHQTAEGGTGLGLPIVIGLMKLHDGEFKLDSILRKGTTATALFPKARVKRTLPAAPDQAEAPVKEPEAPVEKAEVPVKQAETSTEEGEAPVKDADGSKSTKVRKITAEADLDCPSPQPQRPVLSNPSPADTEKRMQTIQEKFRNSQPQPPSSHKPMTGRKNQLQHLKQLAFGNDPEWTAKFIADTTNIDQNSF